ncbi:unnamed protein product [Cylicocyclus nassatus]|uniref:Uncharacterized protein n=1 Tax=Cylicocyclus nassatus TaxID=53992 RepID=A0AA36DTW9_CYLNA|nr:unnamed protein product [Cylicocyclus nassatus]
MFVNAIYYGISIPTGTGSLYEFDARNFDKVRGFDKAKTFARMMVSDPKYEKKWFHKKNNTLCEVGQLRFIDINAWSAVSNA